MKKGMRTLLLTLPAGVLAHNDDTIVWVVLPLTVGLFLYMTTALWVWPYARPIFPLWLLLFVILFPPLFPFLIVYLLFFICTFGIPNSLPCDERPVIVYVTEPAPTKPRSVVPRSLPRGVRGSGL